MRYLIFVILLLAASLSHAADWEDRQVFVSGAGAQKLRVLSSTDTIYLAPMIDSFVTRHGNAQIEYLVTGTKDIDQMLREGEGPYDLVISSAMDLQIKLVNDGFARQLGDLSHPDWAQWRQSLFGFSAEPAAIVINSRTLAPLKPPKTRQDLIRLMRRHPEQFRNRIGTYDIRKSGLGYLFAAQDARTSETFWRLTEVMGALGTQLFCCSGDMIDAVAAGDITVAYNVLGSYALTRSRDNPDITVILPSDFSTVMMRSVFVSNTARNPLLAQEFVSYALRYVETESYASTGPLPQLISGGDDTRRQVIPLEPALMIYLDRLKRGAFVREWESAIIQ
ncbi:MAG: substrate-binding domain-containing protein [Pelagimonas sp.]|jgi:iron(III) transport system substrate-binding protein|nr:substrate-binding domain-containing protein [Pelagimonas sp.]